MSADFLQRVLDCMSDPVFVKDRQHRWVAFNAAFCKLLGLPREKLLNKSDPDLFPPEQVEVFWRLDDQLFASGEINENEEQLTDEAGRAHTIWTRKCPLRDADGHITGLVGVISDITTLRERLGSLDALERTASQQRALLAAQQQALDAMAVPVINVWAGVLLVPLIGEVSPRRVSLVLERLLDAIARNSARTVFLDFSGVPCIDVSSAAMLHRVIAAARLLGADVQIVGVSPDNARIFVTQGIDLRGVVTHPTLREGLRAALLGDERVR